MVFQSCPPLLKWDVSLEGNGFVVEKWLALEMWVLRGKENSEGSYEGHFKFLREF